MLITVDTTIDSASRILPVISELLGDGEKASEMQEKLKKLSQAAMAASDEINRKQVAREIANLLLDTPETKGWFIRRGQEAHEIYT